MRAALRDAGALEFVAALPHGAETVLGEDGAGLSAGQRQRLALARAFLADRPVLLLDEPTAALDGETEAGVVEAVRRLAAGRTVLLVVHRPALLAVADRVVRLTAGAARPCVPAHGPAAPRVRGGRREPDAGGPRPPTPGGIRGAARSGESRTAGTARRGARRPLARVRAVAGARARAGSASRCCSGSLALGAPWG